MAPMSKQFTQTIPVTIDQQAAIDCLAASTDFSKQQLKQVMQKGAVWLQHKQHTRRLRRAKKNLQAGDTVYLYYDEKVLNMTPPEPTLIADEGDYSVWDKPSGMLSQGSKWGDHCAITRWAEQHLQPQRSAFVVHRLDRAANGLLLIAHSKKAAAALSACFQQRKIDKRYRIVVHGDFSQLESPVTVNADIDGRTACSHFSFIAYDAKKNVSSLDVSIDTGRKHQIRRHSAELGFPVVGDRLHGQADDREDLQLCAYEIKFVCPLSGQERRYQLK